jgi:hypothetical protein
VHRARVPHRARARRSLTRRVTLALSRTRAGCGSGGRRLTCAWITHADCRLHEMGEGIRSVPSASTRSPTTCCPRAHGLLVPYDAPAGDPRAARPRHMRRSMCARSGGRLRPGVRAASIRIRR